MPILSALLFASTIDRASIYRERDFWQTLKPTSISVTIHDAGRKVARYLDFSGKDVLFGASDIEKLPSAKWGSFTGSAFSEQIGRIILGWSVYRLLYPTKVHPLVDTMIQNGSDFNWFVYFRSSKKVNIQRVASHLFEPKKWESVKQVAIGFGTDWQNATEVFFDPIPGLITITGPGRSRFQSRFDGRSMTETINGRSVPITQIRGANQAVYETILTELSAQKPVLSIAWKESA